MITAILNRLLEGTNPEQREAIVHDHAKAGALLVLAGAGSGKTTVLTRRLAYLCCQGAAPESLLALTFTRAAALEMKERSLKLCNALLPDCPNAGDMQISTFHSLALKILKESPDDKPNLTRLGFSEKNLNLMNTAQVMKTVAGLRKQVLASAGPVSNAAPRLDDTLDTLERLRNHFDSPHSTDFHRVGLFEHRDYYTRLWSAFSAAKRENGLLDFNDMVSLVLRLFEEYPAVLQHYQNRFRFLAIDEYQDTNIPQYRLFKALAGKNRSIFVVGDDDQSIYRFRGADVGNILKFRSDFPESRIIKLETNYRSTANIIRLANNIFLNKPKEFRKKLKPDGSNTNARFLKNSRIRLKKFAVEDEETRFVLGEIKKLILGEGFKPEEIAILTRTNFEKHGWESKLAGNQAIGIHLSTLHGAKGLQFPVVFYPGLDEGLSPRLPAGKVPEKEFEEQLAEERRLFYVGITRAQYRLYLTSSKKRLWYNRQRPFKSSRFLKTVPWSASETPSLLSHLTLIFQRVTSRAHR